MSVLIPMSGAYFEKFAQQAIDSYAQQNVASGRWPAESALELSRAEHGKLLPAGRATTDNHLFEIQDPKTGTPVGFLWLGVQSKNGTPTGFVFNIEVEREHRRMGYARRALDALEPVARGLGLTAIGLHVFACNDAARALYQALGYEVNSLNMRKELHRDPG